MTQHITTNIIALLSEKLSPLPHTQFISVDGYAGSGKSSLATLLLEKLNAKIIHVDDFATWDQTFPWHRRLIDEVFTPIQNGEQAVSYVKTSWWENHKPKPARNQRITPIMILEGIGASRPELRPYIAVGIFVETPKEVCLERGIKRDLNTGKTREEITNIWQKWQEGEDQYMKNEKPEQYADIIVDGTVPFETQLSF